MRPLLILSVALMVVTTAWTYWPHDVGGQTAESLEGQLLTAGGKEVAPDQIASLRVAKWSDEEKAPAVFEVAVKNGKWVIPSHHDYPADGGSRVGETSGTVLNIRRGPEVAQKVDEHAKLGVVDPLKEGTADADNRGKRITLKDQGGKTLVDIIVGKKAEHADVHYVREADSDLVYTAKVDPDISTKFKDWVETDLFKVSKADIRSFRVQDYSVDEQQGVVKVRAETEFSKPKDAAKWSSPQTPEKKAVNETTLDEVLFEVTGLRLAGVRPFDPNWLQSKGFFLQKDKPPVSNEGSLAFTTKDGMLHQIFFGEIAPDEDAEDKPEPRKKAEAKAAEGAAGAAAKEAKDAKGDPAAEGAKKDDQAAEAKGKEGGEKKGEAKGSNRYMVVAVGYFQDKDEDIAALHKEIADLKKEKEDAAKKEKEAPAEKKDAAGDQKDAKKDEKKDEQPPVKKDYDQEIAKKEKEVAKKQKEGLERMKKAQAKYLQFFYVISDESFKKMRPALEKLFKYAEVEKDKLPGEPVGQDTQLEKKDGDLEFADLKKGEGDEAEEGDEVEVHYTGWLLDNGEKFDSSVDRKEPFKFKLGGGQVIKGWDQGVKGMKVGGKRKLVIPPELGYGESGSPPKIPGKARLVFDVELLKVTKKKAGA